MNLPTYNYEEFVAHVRKGPGFGCWSEGAIERSWGKKDFVDAKDAARSVLRTTGGSTVGWRTQIMLSMLPRGAWTALLRACGWGGRTPIKGFSAMIRLRRRLNRDQVTNEWRPGWEKRAARLVLAL